MARGRRYLWAVGGPGGEVTDVWRTASRSSRPVRPLAFRWGCVVGVHRLLSRGRARTTSCWRLEDVVRVIVGGRTAQHGSGTPRPPGGAGPASQAATGSPGSSPSAPAASDTGRVGRRLVSVLSVTVALGTFPVALLADRWSRVKVIALIGGIWSLATVSAALTRSYGQLFGTRAAVGLGEAGYAPAAGALLSRMFPQRLRATLFGALLSAASLGSVLGVIIGGVVAATWGWRAAFVVVGVPGLALALLFLLVRDYPTVRLPAGQAAGQQLGLRRLLAELLRAALRRRGLPRRRDPDRGHVGAVRLAAELLQPLPGDAHSRGLGQHRTGHARRLYRTDRAVVRRRPPRPPRPPPPAAAAGRAVAGEPSAAGGRVRRDTAGQPAAAVHPRRGLHHHRPVRSGRLSGGGRGGPGAAGHRRVHGRAGAEPVRLRRRPARGRRGIRRVRAQGGTHRDPGILRVRRILPRVRLPPLRQRHAPGRGRRLRREEGCP